MDKHIELVEMPDGNVVAVGPFHDPDKASAFAQHIEYGDGDTGLTSRGGVRMLTVDVLARELGIKPSDLKPKEN